MLSKPPRTSHGAVQRPPLQWNSGCPAVFPWCQMRKGESTSLYWKVHANWIIWTWYEHDRYPPSNSALSAAKPETSWYSTACCKHLSRFLQAFLLLIETPYAIFAWYPHFWLIHSVVGDSQTSSIISVLSFDSELHGSEHSPVTAFRKPVQSIFDGQSIISNCFKTIIIYNNRIVYVHYNFSNFCFYNYSTLLNDINDVLRFCFSQVQKFKRLLKEEAPPKFRPPEPPGPPPGKAKAPGPPAGPPPVAASPPPPWGPEVYWDFHGFYSFLDVLSLCRFFLFVRIVIFLFLLFTNIFVHVCWFSILSNGCCFSVVFSCSFQQGEKQENFGWDRRQNWG